MSAASRRATVYRAVRMRYRFAWRPALLCIGLLVIGAMAAELGLHQVAQVLIPGATAGVVACVVWWWFRHIAQPHSAQAVLARRGELDTRHRGVATRLDLAEHTSKTALRLQATTLRPSLRSRSWRERRWLDPREIGVEVARLGWGWWGEQVWSSCEDATLRIGGPRTGKTLSIAAHGVDAPGALITTSTRLDLAELVHAARSARGTVHFFNPSGLGNVATTVRWRVLDGCEDFAVAQRRATDLIPESASTEGERWDSHARRILALFLHAAAISGRSMRDVARWVADPSTTARDEILDAFLDSGIGEGGSAERASAVRAFYATNERTLTSITTTMATPLAWMSDDRARVIGDPPAGHPDLLDLVRLIEAGETLHLIGHENTSTVAPLIAALVAEIAHTARTLAGSRPGGRLDPPLTMVLDEVALVCPVPLDRWTADMGGRGVTIHISVQSLAQLRNRWGTDAAGAILANVATFLVFGGSPSAADLDDLSTLTGDTEHTTLTDVTTGRRWHRRQTLWDAGNERTARPEVSTRSVPVISPAQIRALEPGQVLVLRRSIPPLVAYAPRVIDRRRYTPATLTQLPGTPASTVVPAAAAVVVPLQRVPTTAELDDLLNDPDTQQPRQPGMETGLDSGESSR